LLSLIVAKQFILLKTIQLGKLFNEEGKMISLMTTDISYQEAIEIMIDEAYLSKTIQKMLNDMSDYSGCLEE